MKEKYKERKTLYKKQNHGDFSPHDCHAFNIISLSIVSRTIVVYSHFFCDSHVASDNHKRDPGSAEKRRKKGKEEKENIRLDNVPFRNLMVDPPPTRWPFSAPSPRGNNGTGQSFISYRGSSSMWKCDHLEPASKYNSPAST